MIKKIQKYKIKFSFDLTNVTIVILTIAGIGLQIADFHTNQKFNLDHFGVFINIIAGAMAINKKSKGK